MNDKHYVDDTAPPRPVQFGLAKLIQFTTVVALWCAAAVVRENVVIGMAYTIVVFAATWAVVGRWAVRLSPIVCRSVLAATTTLLVAGSVGVTVLVDDADYFPIVWMLTVFPVVSFGELVGNSVFWRVVVFVAGPVFLLLLIYLFWIAVFRSWDRLSAQTSQRRLVRVFSALLVLLNLPILASVLSGCYAFHEHEGPLGLHHLWLHCVLHVAMLAGAGTIVSWLHRHARRSTDPPPPWLKLAAWGYLSLYAVLLQVALFPIEFYIP